MGFWDFQILFMMMINFTLTQQSAILLRRFHSFQFQVFITMKAKGKHYPKSPEQRDRQVNSYLVHLARKTNSHIYPIIGVNPIGHLYPDDKHNHTHGILLLNKKIDFQMFHDYWPFGDVVVYDFQPEKILKDIGREALSYVVMKHNHRPMTIICPRHKNNKKCRGGCRWNGKSLLFKGVPPESKRILKMTLNIV